MSIELYLCLGKTYIDVYPRHQSIYADDTITELTVESVSLAHIFRICADQRYKKKLKAKF